MNVVNVKGRSKPEVTVNNEQGVLSLRLDFAETPHIWAEFKLLPFQMHRAKLSNEQYRKLCAAAMMAHRLSIELGEALDRMDESASCTLSTQVICLGAWMEQELFERSFASAMSLEDAQATFNNDMVTLVNALEDKS